VLASFFMRIRLTSLAFAGVLVLCVSAPPGLVAAGLPLRSLGKIDQRYAWVPKDNPVPALDQCAAKAAKTHPASSPLPSPEQTCLMRAMRDAGASNEALAFTRWYYEASHGDSGFITHVRSSRYGVVSVASVELPGKANDNFVFFFVNGTPTLVDPNEIFRVTLCQKTNCSWLSKKLIRMRTYFPTKPSYAKPKHPQGDNAIR
jgi:hypothetical protein